MQVTKGRRGGTAKVVLCAGFSSPQDNKILSPSRAGLSAEFLPIRPGAFGLRAGLRPQANEVFGQIAHAGAGQSLPPCHLAEWCHNSATLNEIRPQIRFQTNRRRMVVRRRAHRRLNFVPPELSLIGVRFPVIKNHLLAAIQAHAATVGRSALKTTANRAPSATLQSDAHSAFSLPTPPTHHLHVAKT